MPTNKLLALLLTIAISLLSACGFKLRGYANQYSPPAFSNLKLDCPSTQAWQLCQTLRQQLTLNNVSLDNDAQYHLIVSPILQDYRTLSIQKNAAAAEFGLSSKVTYQLVNLETDEVISRQEIVIRNSYRHQSSALLAKERERSELQGELSQQIAMEVFRQIDVLNKQILSTEADPE
jgi:outer membrane lipopolysaccharide assembly protein LptE/RlpB